LYVIPYIINKIKILCLEIIKQRTSQNLQKYLSMWKMLFLSSNEKPFLFLK